MKYWWLRDENPPSLSARGQEHPERKLFSDWPSLNLCQMSALGDPPFPQLQLRLIFAYAVLVFQEPANRKQFVVTCKRCRSDVPTGLKEFSFQSVVVECQVCGEQRRYLPSEVFLGKPDHLVAHQHRTGVQ